VLILLKFFNTAHELSHQNEYMIGIYEHWTPLIQYSHLYPVVDF